MAISFQLDLSPNQIEFLQQMDLYADGVIPIGDVTPRGTLGWRMGMTWIGKLIREGLVEHRPNNPAGIHRSGDDPHRYYVITDKGRAVLGLIEQDVQAFLSRQKAYQKAKKKRRAKTPDAARQRRGESTLAATPRGADRGLLRRRHGEMTCNGDLTLDSAKPSNIVQADRQTTMRDSSPRQPGQDRHAALTYREGVSHVSARFKAGHYFRGEWPAYEVFDSPPPR